MSPLSQAVLEAATAALAETAPELNECRNKARVVAVAVLATLGGNRGKQGVVNITSAVAQRLLSMADELDAERDYIAFPDWRLAAPHIRRPQRHVNF